MTTPIPQCLAHLPVQAGLAVPVVAMKQGDRYLISVNNTRWTWDVIAERRCGICGRPLDPGRSVVLTARPDLDHATDPANHPECVAYASKACPMLSGRMDRYRPQDTQGHGPGVCDKPGCCGGYSIAHGPRHDGEPAPDQWYAVWITRYQAAVNEHQQPYGLSWDAKDITRIRPVQRRP